MTISIDIRHFLLSIIALAMFATGCAPQTPYDLQKIENPIQFLTENAIAGGDSVLVPNATLLIGETHGTWEAPIAVASLLRDALDGGNNAVLCVELPPTEQPAIDRFLDSDGKTTAIRNLLQPAFWSGQDGRSSVGMFAMLELARDLRSKGNDIYVRAIDGEWTENANHRDRTMAENILGVRKQFPNAILICLAGNVHTKTTKGAPCDEQYVPMGWTVSQAIPNLVSLKVIFAGGHAWQVTDQGTGKTTMNGEDRGDDPFILIHDAPNSGCDGVFYVGAVTAAKPAFANAGE